MTIYQLAFSGLSASTDGAASVQILRKGTIKQVLMTLRGLAAATGCGLQMELSKIPYSQTYANGAQLGPLAVVEWINSFTTSGQSKSSENLVVPMNYPIGQLEYLYLNVIETGTVTSMAATVLVYVQD